MGKFVTNGASLRCSFGTTPCSLIVTDASRPKCGNMLMATINDMIPSTNIPTFGMCMTTSNPQVATATSAAFGTLTPQPCVPAITAPWAPGSALMKVKGSPALTDSCTCSCMWSGVISVQNPGNSARATVK